MNIRRCIPAVWLAVLVLLGAFPSLGQAPGGRLNLRLREDLPQGFAINESPTISTMWPVMPCFSNLVLFDPFKPTHSAETIIGEFAERWSWQDSYRKLVFFLRTDVKWHDGKPFSARDVTYTFDLLREAPDAPAKLRLNPQREWYANVESVDAVDPQTVVVRRARAGRQLPHWLHRHGAVQGEGVAPGRVREYVKNPDYFVKSRPNLDGLRYVIIAERGTAAAALQAGRVDVAFPGETPSPSPIS